MPVSVRVEGKNFADRGTVVVRFVRTVDGATVQVVGAVNDDDNSVTCLPPLFGATGPAAAKPSTDDGDDVVESKAHNVRASVCVLCPVLRVCVVPCCACVCVCCACVRACVRTCCGGMISETTTRRMCGVLGVM